MLSNLFKCGGGKLNMSNMSIWKFWECRNRCSSPFSHKVEQLLTASGTSCPATRATRRSQRNWCRNVPETRHAPHGRPWPRERRVALVAWVVHSVGRPGSRPGPRQSRYKPLWLSFPQHSDMETEMSRSYHSPRNSPIAQKTLFTLPPHWCHHVGPLSNSDRLLSWFCLPEVISSSCVRS